MILQKSGTETPGHSVQAVMSEEMTPRSQRLRFADFELDTATGELRRAGLIVALEPQPARVLVAIAGRPGQLVTKDELRALVWDAAVFVDFEQGLHYAVRQIRRALGDSARQPVFIETVARRGYRFIAPVEEPPVAVPPAGTPAVPPAGTPALLSGPLSVLKLLVGAAAVVLALSVPWQGQHSDSFHSADEARNCRRHHDAVMAILRGTHDLVFGPASPASSVHHRPVRDMAKALHDLVY